MSQDTGHFSVRRPRETLGAIQYNSSIPQPTSTVKRTSSMNFSSQPTPFSVQHGRPSSRMSLAPGRQSMFSRSSSGNNINDLGSISTVKRSSTANIFQSGSASRKSYAPGSALAQSMSASQSLRRRSSVYSRPSAVGPIGHQSFFQQAPIPAGVPKDPRPLKDRSYQARIGQELLEYLAQNNFELEMKHQLGQNTIRSPTQKDFNYIFQWLYHRIDPSYRFIKNIDQEVPPILKQLRYPYERGITKSQISAVGGQNWSTFLGMLHWMMGLAQMADRYYAGEYDAACAEAGVDVSGDRIIFQFLTNAYRDWLQVGEEDDDEDADKLLIPHVEQMAADFEAGNQKYLEELTVLEAENKSLREQIEEFEKSAPDVAKLEKHFKILEDDKRKFEEYNNSVESKVEKYEGRVRLLQEEIEKTDAELEDSEKERRQLQESVDKQGITIQDIDRMNVEQDRLQKGVVTTTARLEEISRKVVEKEVETAKRLEELERTVGKYNSLGYQVAVIPSTAANAHQIEYELSLNVNEGPNFSSSQLSHSQRQADPENDRLIQDANSGYTPAHLLNLDVRGSVRTNLLKLKKEINERRRDASDADMKNYEFLDSINEAIDEKRGEVEALEHRVRAAEEEFEKTKDVTTTQKLASDAQIEKMEKELAKMRASLTESVQLMEQREMNTNIEYEQLTLRASSLREELHTEIERILNDVIKFKVHVQKSLEDYEGFVVEEVEGELGQPAEGDVSSSEDGGVEMEEDEMNVDENNE